MIAKFRLARKLGMLNVVRVILYRLQIKTGWLKFVSPIVASAEGEFFQSTKPTTSDLDESVRTHHLFGWKPVPLNKPPHWHFNFLTEHPIRQTERHWTQLADFDPQVGDIKGVWEVSRFGWVLDFALAYNSSNNDDWLSKLNAWLNDWLKANPVNQGNNWKCAQEASIRVMHLAAASMLMGQRKPNETMFRFVEQHLLRIYPTLGYAKAQDNNHGTSEAAALIIGSSWLLQAQPQHAHARVWLKKGRTYLQNRIHRLVMEDGSFSQYSVNYHRLMLDSMSLTALWLRFQQQPSLPSAVQDRLGAAANWLFQLIEASTGDVPNFGNNDGAHILNYARCGYRDFRPSTELACQLFLQKTAFKDAGSQKIVSLFDLQGQETMQRAMSVKFSEGGLALVRNSRALCLLRLPCFKFRPGQADILHLDLWLDGQNVLRDAGSYSYNTDEKWLSYFGGVAGHNTVQFDGHDQMPKVSRFLYGEWPDCETFNLAGNRISGSYKDWTGARHHREVRLQENQVVIIDQLSGFQHSACLRWRLAKLDWQLDDQAIESKNIHLAVKSSQHISRMALAEGFESLYYGKKDAIPVLEIEVDVASTITTIISWT